VHTCSKLSRGLRANSFAGSPAPRLHRKFDLIQRRCATRPPLPRSSTLAGGNIQVTTNSSTIADDVALLEYAVTSSHVTVSDGVDSFVIDNGLIVVQTAHLGGLAIQ
jgi:hypothetical protein